MNYALSLRPFIALTFLAAVAASACGTSARATKRNTGGNQTGGQGGTASTSCTEVKEGCECPKPGDTAKCKVVENFGDYTTCTVGDYTCGDDGLWGPCVGIRTTTTP